MSENPELGIWKILGKRWTLPILKIVSSEEPVRYCEIKRTLAGVSSTMLSERLGELEREGLVDKRFFGLKVEYSLTASARELEFILVKLDRWRYRHKLPLIANYQ
jgi:DNA-binding HxlR family transcriptional regulator